MTEGHWLFSYFKKFKFVFIKLSPYFKKSNHTECVFAWLSSSNWMYLSKALRKQTEQLFSNRNTVC